MGCGVIREIKWPTMRNAAPPAKPRTWQMVRVRGSITASPVPFLMEVLESAVQEPGREREGVRSTQEARAR